MKKIIIFSLFFIFLILIVLFFQPLIKIEEIKNIQTKINELAEKRILTPPPLKVLNNENFSESNLTKQGIINYTNVERQKYGLTPLKENKILNAMAQAKIDDMFNFQYFAHESPLKEEVGDIALNFNYQFIAIGENLAMGNFSDDQDLVLSWMNSPGHRENILNKKYQEIGVAVKKGIFEEKMVWLAVQHFGLSSTICPKPDKSIIDEQELIIKNLEKNLSEFLDEIKKIKSKISADYRKKVEQYNNLVEEYNKLLLENKKNIEDYNKEVQIFNQCLENFK